MTDKEYKKEVEQINEACKDIMWEAERITDLLILSDYVEIRQHYIDSLLTIESKLQELREEFE